MSHAYAPTAAALTTITVPDDGDLRSAASVNLPLQQLADAVAGTAPRADLLTAPTGTWTVPAGVTRIEIQSIPGGGGGAGGTPGDNVTPTTRSAYGGGGGAGGRKVISRQTVTPGAVLSYVNGVGGTAGTGAAAGGTSGNGGEGGDSSFAGVTCARGGGGGTAMNGTGTSALISVTPGGRCPRPLNVFTVGTLLAVVSGGAFVTECQNGGQGGMNYAAAAPPATDGGCATDGYVGGALGAAGTTATNRGGGGGGGGGAGSAGGGAAGGAGGAGTTGATGGAGTAGTAASAGTGGGGGGGGGGGQAATTGGAGGAGGAGGSGSMVIIYFGPQATFT